MRLRKDKQVNAQTLSAIETLHDRFIELHDGKTQSWYPVQRFKPCNRKHSDSSQSDSQTCCINYCSHEIYHSVRYYDAEESYYYYYINPLNPELNPICYLLALLGVHHFLHLSRIRVKSLTFRLLMSYIYIYGASILDVSRSHTTTQHSR